MSSTSSTTSGSDDVWDDSSATTVSPSGTLSSALQAGLIELYAGILLSQAHLAFFVPVVDDTIVGQDSLHQGKAKLEEAERLCLSREESMNRQLLAKCYYVRGFLADVSGEDKDARRLFQQAVAMDGKYWRLKRVRWHLQRTEDAEELVNMSEPTSAFGRDERPLSLRRSSLFNPASPGSAVQSALFGRLMHDVSRIPIKARPRDVSALSSFNTASPSVASPPFRSPRSAGSGRLDMDGIIEKLKNAPAQIRKSPDSMQGSLGTERGCPVNAPLPLSRIPRPKDQRDASRVRLAKLKTDFEKARVDNVERLQAYQQACQLVEQRSIEVHKAYLALSGQPPPGQETLLSDTPSISELGTADTALQNPERPLRPFIDTRMERRQSASYGASPTSPSPLRKAFLPGDE